MMKWIASALVLLVAGCSTSADIPAQQAQKARPDAVHSLDMETLCRENAAHRYNTVAEKIAVTRFEQFQGSFEMRGTTPRHEAFVCAFDAEGQFLHLSMR
ncbi:YsaB family lipoprotein [Enterobacter sp. Bisph1]|uniref:YsaB family lipoprotein n=1 Tax=Enterobacter sp. Bisph1 TaxID=1274399 RepID=UPI00057BDBA8|nr:YsaB family lipoprotein [Enterobacter sp. Bisph1]